MWLFSMGTANSSHAPHNETLNKPASRLKSAGPPLIMSERDRGSLLCLGISLLRLTDVQQVFNGN